MKFAATALIGLLLIGTPSSISGEGVTSGETKVECPCGPGKYQFTLDFSLLCRPDNRFCSVISFDNTYVPSSVGEILIGEGASIPEAIIFDGPTFEYTPLVNSPHIDLTISMSGLNIYNNRISLTQRIMIECDKYPDLSKGINVAWARLTGVTPGDTGVFCPLAGATPTAAPVEDGTPSDVASTPGGWCPCGPGKYQFTLDFSLLCRPDNRFCSVISFNNTYVPSSVGEILIGEGASIPEAIIFDGPTFEYTPLVNSPRIDLTISMSGLNIYNNRISLTQRIMIECDKYPDLSKGINVAWARLTGVTPGDTGVFCPLAGATPIAAPVVAPTVEIGAPEQEP
jgi:hypothetical protein